MMKRLFIAALACGMAIGHAKADQQCKIELDNKGRVDTTITVGSSILLKVSMDKVEFAPTSKVNLKIENVSYNQLLVMSGCNYTESELKKMRPRMLFHKTFPGTKGLRRLDVYDELKEYHNARDYQYVLLHGFEKCELSRDVQTKDAIEWRIPIYIARYKNARKKKIQILEKQIVELEVTTEIKPNEDHLALERVCDSLIKEINDTVICAHKRHEPSSDVIVKSYEDKIKELKEQIESTAFSYSSCDDYREYGDPLFERLVTRLDSVDLKSRLIDDCGNHKVVAARNRCKYCNMSYNEVFNRLDDCYFNLDNGDVEKVEILGEVNALYRCCTQHPNRRRGNWNDYKGQIEKVYQSIINF